MKNILKLTAGITAFTIGVDFLGFSAWVLSGQTPADDFYIGTITAHIIKLFI